MGQLLVMLIVPPIVGVVTYVVIRLVSKRDEDDSERHLQSVVLLQNFRHDRLGPSV